MSDETSPIPLWVSGWQGREQLADLLGVSVRTVQRRVRRGDIERREDASGGCVYRPRLTAWTRTQIGGATQGGDRATGEGDTRGRHGATGGGCRPDGPPHMRSTTWVTDEGDNVGVTCRPGATPELEELRREVDALRVELGEARARIAQLEQRDGAPTSDPGDEGRGAGGELEGWRGWAVLVLMRVKLWAEWMRRRLEE